VRVGVRDRAVAVGKEAVMFGRHGDPEAELVELVNGFTFGIRKVFGMFGQIQVRAVGATREELTVKVWTRHPRTGDDVAPNVRNALVNTLGDVLPIPTMRIVYSNPTLGIEGEEHVFPLWPPGDGSRRSQAIVVEAVVGPQREAARKRFRRAWRRLERSA
jgi:hypothetical protein